MKREKEVKIIAHRGFSECYLENSIIAFDRAIKEGVYGIETDVRMSEDNIAFIFHDKTLKKITGKKDIFENQHSNYLKKEKILTLDTLLTHINGKTNLILEIKYNKKTYKQACEVINNTITDKLIWIEVSSFSDEILHLIHILNPKIKLHKLIDKKRVLQMKNFDKIYSFISYFDIDIKLKDEDKTKELLQKERVIFWVVENEDISKSIKLGLYAAMSNNPIKLKEHLKFLQQKNL